MSYYRMRCGGCGRVTECYAGDGLCDGCFEKKQEALEAQGEDKLDKLDMKKEAEREDS